MFIIILTRLFMLQVIQHQSLKQWSEKNFLRIKIVPKPRGNILDCNGIALATNYPVSQIVWKGSGNKQLSTEQLQAIKIMTDILGEQNIPPLAAFKKAEKFCLEQIIAQNVTSEQLYLIAEQCSDTTNIILNTQFERFYPYQNLACHILGYLRDLEMYSQGKMGLEKLFEETLRGDPSIMQLSMNSFGTLLNSEIIKTGTSGQDIVTSIDLPLQQIVESAMQNELEGTCLIMDPKTGMIKALVSKPNFDPTLFSKKLSPEEWNDLQEQKVFLNRAFNASYPPASIFKLVTIAAALEEKIINTNSHFMCNGYTAFKGRDYYCSKKTGHGYIDTKDALAFSCNIPFFEIAKKLHIDTLASYAFEFGLGNKTNVAFGEKIGLIPTNEWKIMTKGERWWMGETLSASIGQSFLLVTPIQIACLISAIFHGHLVQPQILANAPVEKRPINIQSSTRNFLQECMRAATISGTAQRMNKIGTLTIFAKTGTAQTKTRPNDQKPDDIILERKYQHHAWFVSYFYTETTQPLVMVMLLEHVGKSTYASKVAYRFFADYMKMLKKQEKNNRSIS